MILQFKTDFRTFLVHIIQNLNQKSLENINFTDICVKTLCEHKAM